MNVELRIAHPIRGEIKKTGEHYACSPAKIITYCVLTLLKTYTEIKPAVQFICG